MGVVATYTSMLKGVVTLTDTNIDTADATVTYNNGASTGINTTKSLPQSSPTVIPCTTYVTGEKALSSGAGTIDLRVLVGVNGGAVDLNGLKVQAVKFRNKSTNANPITITFGASNPYLLGGSGFLWILAVGQEMMVFLNEASPDVDATHKTIDLAGTGSQVLEYAIVAG